jgi:hypothetical protein
MANEFVARNGIIALNDTTISGSLSVTNNISGGSVLAGNYLASGNTTISIPFDTGGSKAYFNASSISGPALSLVADSLGRGIRISAAADTTNVGVFDISTTRMTIGSNTATPVAFFYNAAEVMRITDSKVGINKTTPNAALDISGSLLVSGSISVSGSVINNLTASYAASASYIQASGVVGLNLSQIASGSITASVDPAYGFKVNSNTQLSGSVIVTGSLSVSGFSSFTNNASTGVLRVQNLSVSGWSSFEIYNSASTLVGGFGWGNASAAALASTMYFDVSGNNPFVIRTNNSERIRFFGNGNVGINTGATDGGFRLDVNGSTRLNGNTQVTGSLNVSGSVTTTGTITAQTLIVQTVSSSIIYSSGSNIFGNKATDTQQFTGSVLVSGSITVSGSVTNNLTASYALNADALDGINSTQLATTGSNIFRGTQSITGSLIVSSSTFATAIIGSGSGVFTVDGTSGRLFSVDDSLSGSLFSVNTAAGLPVIEAFSDNTVRIGQFGKKALFVSQSRVGFGKETLLNGDIDVSGSVVITGSLAVSGSIINNLTASFAISASYADNFNAGYAKTFAQLTPAVTWSFIHNLNSRTPLVQVYDLDHNQLIPANITNNSVSSSLITFATLQAGYVVLSTGGLSITGSNAILSQTTPSATWSFAHNLNTQFPVFTVFDSSNNVIVPLQINATNANSASIYFSSPQIGTAVAANCGLSGSGFILAQTASYVNPLNQTVIITGSLIVSGSGTFRNIGPAAFTGSTAVSGAFNVIGDITGSNLLVTNRITTQTLVVQTITSSVSFITGSTKFGVLAANTHQFTGSVLISGSATAFAINNNALFVSSSGNVGIATSSPASKLEVNDTNGIPLRFGDISTSITGQTAGYIGMSTSAYSGNNGDLVLFPRTSATSKILLMSGSVGIGTTTPGALLHIFGAGSGNSVTYTKYTCGDGGDIRIGKQDGVNNNAIFGTWSNNDVQLYSNSTEKMRITTGGNVLIYQNLGVNTSDGSDNTYLSLSGASDAGDTRGARIYLSGNERAIDAGNLVLAAGNSTTGTGAPGTIVFRTGADSEKMRIAYNGSIGAPSGTNIYNASDIRLKQNVTTITDGLDKVMGLNPVKFNWIHDFEPTENDKDLLGFIAQEVQTVLPEAVENFGGNLVTVGETVIENPLRVNEKFIIPVLVKAIQELKAENDTLKEILQRNNIQ